MGKVEVLGEGKGEECWERKGWWEREAEKGVGRGRKSAMS